MGWVFGGRGGFVNGGSGCVVAVVVSLVVVVEVGFSFVDFMGFVSGGGGDGCVASSVALMVAPMVIFFLASFDGGFDGGVLAWFELML